MDKLKDKNAIMKSLRVAASRGGPAIVVMTVIAAIAAIAAFAVTGSNAGAAAPARLEGVLPAP